MALGDKIGDIFLRANNMRVDAYWYPADGTPEVFLCSIAQSAYNDHPHLRELFIELATEVNINRGRRASGWFSPLPDVEIGGVADSSWRLCVLASRQAHREHRAFAWLARHGHVTAHHARELAREGKAKPRAAEALSGCGIGLAELLEQLSLLLRCHANAGVSDRELDPVATVGDPTRPQPDLAFLGELAGIAQQIEQYLPQPHGVHSQCAEALLGIDDEAVLVLLGKLSGGADDLVDQRC